MFAAVLFKVLGVFFLLLLGIIGGKTKAVTKKTLPALNTFLFNFILPCLMISAMQMDSVTFATIGNIASSCLVFGGVMIILGLLSFLILKPLHLTAEEEGLYRFQIAFTNSGFMCIPLTAAIFPEQVTTIVIVMAAMFSLVCYSFGIWLISFKKGGHLNGKDMVKQMLNPPMIAALGGTLLFLLNIKLPEWLMTNIDLTADAVSPVAMFIVGVNLSYSNFSSIFTKNHMILTVVSLIFVPLFTFGCCKIAGINTFGIAAVTFAMAMPSPSIATIFAHKYGLNPVAAAEQVTITTLFSLVTTPIWAYLMLIQI